MKYLLTLVCAAGLLISSGLGAANAAQTEPFGPGSTLLFLGGEAVRQELQLTPRQAKQLDVLRGEYRQQARAITQSVPLGQPAPGTLAKLQTLTAKYDARALDLLTPNQAANLQALQHRALGAWMITLPSVQDDLAMTSAQRARVGQILENFDARVDELNRQTFAGDLSNARRLDLLKSARLKETRNLERFLTPSQKQSLKDLARRPEGVPTEGCSR